MTRTKNAMGVRLTLDGSELLARLGGKLGLSKAATIEYAIRRVAEQEGITLDDTGFVARDTTAAGG